MTREELAALNAEAVAAAVPPSEREIPVDYGDLPSMLVDLLLAETELSAAMGLLLVRTDLPLALLSNLADKLRAVQTLCGLAADKADGLYLEQKALYEQADRELVEWDAARRERLQTAWDEGARP